MLDFKGLEDEMWQMDATYFLIMFHLFVVLLLVFDRRTTSGGQQKGVITPGSVTK
ncbi:hypothetical protein HNQ50_003069 [Silvimonas terrae]|uniref:Uncharacterized protein n=1 Tax=Silvimonas terrae TaxID=300266 RepID=A0A840RIH8_9NEIS|nr:hypothetical protein [Silvimonas terrae]MBB5192328.1 hypothetical protein [Silvimonas terrae]